MRTLACAGALAAALAAAPVAAQDATLARVDSLVAGTRLTEARATLERWLASPAGRNREGDVAAHALLLRGQLTTAADTALPLYLELALNYPASRFAPEALLRLGQGYLALGEAERAEGYLHRLGRDYPTWTERPTALLWLARAQLARRRTTEACATLRDALANPALTADSRTLLEQEQARCTATAATPSATPPAKPTATPPDSPAGGGARERASAARTTTSAAASQPANRFTIQVGAFRDPAAADALARRLRSRDIDARVVHVGTGTLYMVRAGRFARSSDAVGLLGRVRAVAPDAVIAPDATRERAIAR